MKHKIFIISIFVLFMISITACGGSTSIQPTETSIPVLPTETETPAPTATATLEPTATEIPSPTPSATITLTPTPLADFPNARMISVEKRANGLTVIFEISGIQQAYGVKINDKDYQCSFEPQYPNRLFCFGPTFAIGTIDLQFYSQVNPAEVVYQSSYAVPGFVYPTEIPLGDPTTWCPLRGQDIQCETEVRLDLDGKRCIVSTCFDACGYYYSIHTCPDGSKATIP